MRKRKGIKKLKTRRRRRRRGLQEKNREEETKKETKRKVFLSFVEVPSYTKRVFSALPKAEISGKPRRKCG